jgi:predicted RNA-binding protein with PUA-like domain
MNHWLVKTEPSTYSIDDLVRDKRTQWDGVRNYQARNFMRDDMNKGDLVFIYHSSCDEPGVAGIAEVARSGYPDLDDPRWVSVDLRIRRRFKRTIPLSELRGCRGLDGMQLLKRGNRLSVMPVSSAHWARIVALE